MVWRSHVGAHLAPLSQQRSPAAAWCFNIKVLILIARDEKKVLIYFKINTMGELPLPFEHIQEEGGDAKGQTTREKVDNTLTDELIIGICAPIGSSKNEVIDLLKKNLTEVYNYNVIEIKLSKLIQTKDPETRLTVEAGKTPAYTELMNKINGGNALREKHSHACLAELVISNIYSDRVKELATPTEIEKLKSRRVCYIIDSIKNKEELNVFRKVYKDIFYLFSVFSPKTERKENLRLKHLSLEEINNIINTDDYENNKHGQNVRNTFTEADFFIRVSEKNKVELDNKIKRYLHLIFESQIITPRVEEIAMYEAKSAAGNSACLSRQVGAAITNKKGEIISTGWNDVPKFGGNLYREGNSIDKRCKLMGECKNDTTKNQITEDIINSILTDPRLSSVLNSTHEPALWHILRNSSKIRDLIEFSRAVHAEMHAIITGSQLTGNKMVNGKLFCTTYPCHNCARHIIVSGIKEVYYIEPYAKSLCLELHSDAITEDESEGQKVKLLIYDGVAPRRFLEFFTMVRERKDSEGKVLPDNFHNIVPKNRMSIQALPTLEIQAIHSLHENGLLDK